MECSSLFIGLAAPVTSVETAVHDCHQDLPIHKATIPRLRGLDHRLVYLWFDFIENVVDKNITANKVIVPQTKCVLIASSSPTCTALFSKISLFDRMSMTDILILLYTFFFSTAAVSTVYIHLRLHMTCKCKYY